MTDFHMFKLVLFSQRTTQLIKAGLTAAICTVQGMGPGYRLTDFLQACSPFMAASLNPKKQGYAMAWAALKSCVDIYSLTIWNVFLGRSQAIFEFENSTKEKTDLADLACHKFYPQTFQKHKSFVDN